MNNLLKYCYYCTTNVSATTILNFLAAVICSKILNNENGTSIKKVANFTKKHETRPTK